MDIVIFGAGKVGSYAAKVLSQEEHNVTLIDKNPSILEQIGREADVATVHAKGPVWELFEELTETKRDLFFAATGSDDTNLVACSIAKNLGFPKTIARVKETDYFSHSRLDFERLFFVDHFVSAEILAAQDLFHALIHNEDLAAQALCHGTVQMRTIKVPDLWDKAAIPIKDLSLPENLIIGLIRRRTKEGEEALIPHGENHILPGDEIAIVGESSIMNKIHEIFPLPQHPLKSVILFGATLVAEHLTRLLLKQKIAVRVVDYDLPRCQSLADRFPEATIINRDGRDPSFLKGERIQDASAAIASTYHDGTNMLIAAIAKQFGCPKAFALTANPAFTPILDKIGVFPALSAQANLANRILSILHEETIISVGSLCNDLAKIVEIKIAPSSKCVGIPLSDLRLPKDLLIAVIQSRGKVMIGKGDGILSPEDSIIVICPASQIPQLPKLFH